MPLPLKKDTETSFEVSLDVWEITKRCVEFHEFSTVWNEQRRNRGLENAPLGFSERKSHRSGGPWQQVKATHG